MGISKLISQLNWEGEFCFASPKWTEELKERVGYTFNDHVSTNTMGKIYVKNYEQ